MGGLLGVRQRVEATGAGRREKKVQGPGARGGGGGDEKDGDLAVVPSKAKGQERA